MPSGLTRQSIEKRLQDLCMKSLNQLNKLSLIQMNEENMDVRPTESGRLMARYCISYKTAELFLAFKGDESLQDMLSIISKCQEFDDIKLRNNEKKTLNTLNKDKNRITIRYPMTGKIKTTDMKVNCLIQATFGSLLIQDFALQQDTNRIFRAGIRVTRCLVEFLSQKSQFKCLLSALLLCKSFKARLWEDSKYVSKQLDGIGPTLSTALVNAGLTTFEKLEEKDPREIELIVNRHPPFGNQVKDNIAKLPKYELVIEQVMRYSINTADIVITLQITNRETLTNSTGHTCTLLVGDADNKVIFKQRIMDALLLKETCWTKKLEVKRADKGPELSVHYISQDWVGLDVECTYTPNYLGGNRMTSSNLGNQQTKGEVNPGNMSLSNNKPCLHTCHNKLMCAHECCKNGVSSKRRNTTNQPTPKPASTKQVASHLQELKHRAATLPSTPSVNKRIRLEERGNSRGLDLSRFAYAPSRLNGRVSEGSATSSDRLGIYGEQALDNVACDRPEWHLDIQRQNINVRPRNDWQELDMYAKHRQTFNPDDGILNDEASLPDIEASAVEYADCNLDMDTADNWETLDDCNDGFGHETDYGYTYVTNDDRPDLPLEWDDRMNEQWQQTNRNLKDSKCNLGRTKGRQTNSLTAQSFVPGSYETLPYKHSTRKPTVIKQAVYGVSPVDNVYGASYSSNNRTPSKAALRESTAQGCKDDLYYSGNTRKYLEPNKANSDNKTITGKQPFFNRNRFPQNASSSVIDDRCDDYYQCLTNRENSHCNSLRNESAKALQGLSNASYVTRTLPSDNDENIDPDEYIDLYDEGTDGHPSRWTNYFSSQSSSASDNLNWKYPTRNCDNKVVMETCDLSNTQNTQQTSRRKDATAVNGATRLNTNISDNYLDNDKDHKYGEVLAWVSSSERAQKDKLQSKSSTARASTLTSKPEQDSFMGIFDGIL